MQLRTFKKFQIDEMVDRYHYFFGTNEKLSTIKRNFQFFQHLIITKFLNGKPFTLNTERLRRITSTYQNYIDALAIYNCLSPIIEKEHRKGSGRRCTLFVIPQQLEYTTTTINDRDLISKFFKYGDSLIEDEILTYESLTEKKKKLAEELKKIEREEKPQNLELPTIDFNKMTIGELLKEGYKITLDKGYKIHILQ